MLAYVALGRLSDRLSEKVTITTDMISGVSGTRYGLSDGETVTIRDLFYIAFTGCYNDAVTVLAKLAAGDLTSFIALMNSTAAELGMTNTHYTNPTGMHDRLMRTTVADVCRLAAALAENDFYMRLTSEPKYTLEGSDKNYTVSNRNELVSKLQSGKYYNQLCRGMNVGMTEESGYSLTTVAVKDSTTYICVVMGGKETEDGKNTAYLTANSLIEWAFRSFGYREVLSTATVISEIPVTLSSDADTVLLVPAESFYCYLPTSAVIGTDVTFTTRLTVESLEAPVSAGVSCGYITISYDGKDLRTVPLVSQDSSCRQPPAKADGGDTRILAKPRFYRNDRQRVGRSRCFITQYVRSVRASHHAQSTEDTIIDWKIHSPKACGAPVFFNNVPKTIDTPRIWRYN